MSKIKVPQQTIKTLGKENALGLALFEQITQADWAQQVTIVSSPKTRIQGYFLHPCYVNDRLTIIHARGLQSADPRFFQALQAFADSNAYTLLAERRHKNSVVVLDRRTWLPVVMFTVGMNTAVAAKEFTDNKGAGTAQLALFDAQVTLSEPSTQPQQVTRTLALNNVSFSETLTDHMAVEHGIPKVSELDQGDVVSHEAAEILDVLQDHYTQSENDPAYIQADLKEMADYFSRYPEASKLLKELRDESWQLFFAKNTFKTEVRGNAFQVYSANIHFDSRAAAKLRSHRACDEKLGACIASPADALLHELLHAKAALLTPETFIEQGGMNSVIYPYAHEQTVIQGENSLYRSMTSVDGRLRPQRHRHSGRLAMADCVTCIK